MAKREDAEMIEYSIAHVLATEKSTTHAMEKQVEINWSFFFQLLHS